MSCTEYLFLLTPSFHTIVIGGGAAGYFAAIHAAAGGRVCILEKTAKVLTKVIVSGGGRCNVTHACPYASNLVKNYPRGGKQLRKAFERFGTAHTTTWFEQRGIALKTEADGRMFPTTNRSETIARCLQDKAERLGVQLLIRSEVTDIAPQPDSTFGVSLSNGTLLTARKVIVTTGGFSKPEGYGFIARLGIAIAPPVPSLFTFNVPQSDLKDLQGIAVTHGSVSIPGSDWRHEGPVLITHWGFSGPAVIKLSAWAAIDLHARHYQFPIHINFTGMGEAQVRERLREAAAAQPRKQVHTAVLFGIPARLWERLCQKADVPTAVTFANLPARSLNRLVEMLVRAPFEVAGKTTYKEEFVTCGGVELSEVDLLTFESKRIPGLYFAGEVLHVDGITGGFNFQHAWTSGYLAGTHAAGQGRLSPNRD